ncbi:AAA family ATPase [Dysgonomonas mossii]|uniref:Uncharacterized protein n=1 Tax=Dysgonomonas mossii TaxID=163665 RepID=A0A4Y9IS01_9BACT|nr:AAA family ATPase [Dysgonomonas mossii]MBF0760193.1 AAA family ATPase [Dysgonomonas mossii]TFU91142.1 hypothetical protein E4T88_03935 [Dysgonomonas mossii]
MSFLKLNSLLVTKDGKEVYFEEFHSGVNIIRGDNSSGKSTISNFIYFIIGGDFSNWLPEAASCDFVYAEVTLNGAVATFKREITQKSLQPMSVFWGTIDKALSSSFEGWKNYPYSRRTPQTESFSQIIFKALDFPLISSDNEESITFNQILRLIYIDQLSSLDSLMRNEDFDSPTIRTAVGNLLIGTYDDDLLKKEMSKKEKEKELSEVKKNIKALDDIFDKSPLEFDKKTLGESISEKEGQLGRIISTLKSPDILLDTIKKNDIKNEIKDQQKNLNNIKNEYKTLLNYLEKENMAIVDSDNFIEVLNNKLTAIKESLNSRNILGSLPIQYCPICMEKLDEPIDDCHCHLCKKQVSANDGNTKLIRMKIEIETQIAESTVLQKDRLERIDELKEEIKKTERELTRIQSTYDLLISQSRTTYETKYDELWVMKGKLDAQIDFLKQQLQLTESYESYKNKQFLLIASIEKLTDEIERLKKLQRSKATNAYSRIQYYALELLKGDGQYEDKFQNGDSISISFHQNLFYLNDRNRFSASSMVLLKNCVRFAIFFASLELNYFRYPRFILCDNMEDKGMVEARSKNFQRNIVRLANDFDVNSFQIIFSTSMIDESLDIPKYTVGEFYSANNKSLKLS